MEPGGDGCHERRGSYDISRAELRQPKSRFVGPRRDERSRDPPSWGATAHDRGGRCSALGRLDTARLAGPPRGRVWSLVVC